MQNYIHNKEVATALLHKRLAASLYKDLRRLLALRHSSIENLILAGIFNTQTAHNLRQLRKLPRSQAILEACAHVSAYLRFSFRSADRTVTVLIDPHADWTKQCAQRIFRFLPELHDEPCFHNTHPTHSSQRFRRLRFIQNGKKNRLVRVETIVAFAADYGFETDIGMLAKRKHHEGFRALHACSTISPSHTPPKARGPAKSMDTELYIIDSLSDEFKGFHAAGDLKDVAKLHDDKSRASYEDPQGDRNGRGNDRSVDDKDGSDAPNGDESLDDDDGSDDGSDDYDDDGSDDGSGDYDDDDDDDGSGDYDDDDDDDGSGDYEDDDDDDESGDYDDDDDDDGSGDYDDDDDDDDDESDDDDDGSDDDHDDEEDRHGSSGDDDQRIR
jgi:hypothetical protein